jgi:hypothetical protein
MNRRRGAGYGIASNVLIALLVSSSGAVRSQSCDAICEHYAHEQAMADSAQFWEQYSRELEIKHQRRAEANRLDNAARASDYWGAIAIDNTTWRWSISMQQPGATEAMAAAIDACQAKECRLVAVFKNTCIAPAYGTEGRLLFAEDTSASAARRKAAAACETTSAHCSTPEEQTVCSGYRYVDSNSGERGDGQKSLSSKYRQYMRGGGLIGILSPGLAGKTAIQTPEATFDPFLIRLLSYPEASRNTPAKVVGTGRVMWGAITASKQYGNFGMAMGPTEGIAVVESKRKCEQGDCDVVATYSNGTCIALAAPSEKNAPATVFFGKGRDEATAKSQALNKCAALHGSSCAPALSHCMPTSG